MQTVNALNDQWANDRVSFYFGPGGLPIAELEHERDRARVALHGAHVLAYAPDEERPVLWLSDKSIFADKKAIRGGIPVCWPWFANHPSEPDFPAHGFARTRTWEVVATGQDPHFSSLTLALRDSEATCAWFPYPFRLELCVTLSETLKVRLTVINTGEDDFTYTGALHSYLAVSHIDSVHVEGLEGRTYIDSLDEGERKAQDGPIRFTEEVDRIYVDTEDACVLCDAGWDRQIRIAKSGSRSTVVWNPWIAKAQRMVDFGDEEYQQMLCVETANAADDVVTLPGGGKHEVTVEFGMVYHATMP